MKKEHKNLNSTCTAIWIKSQAAILCRPAKWRLPVISLFTAHGIPTPQTHSAWSRSAAAQWPPASRFLPESNMQQMYMQSCFEVLHGGADFALKNPMFFMHQDLTSKTQTWAHELQCGLCQLQRNCSGCRQYFQNSPSLYTIFLAPQNKHIFSHFGGKWVESICFSCLHTFLI